LEATEEGKRYKRCERNGTTGLKNRDHSLRLRDRDLHPGGSRQTQHREKKGGKKYRQGRPGGDSPQQFLPRKGLYQSASISLDRKRRKGKVLRRLNISSYVASPQRHARRATKKGRQTFLLGWILRGTSDIFLGGSPTRTSWDEVGKRTGRVGGRDISEADPPTNREKTGSGVLRDYLKKGPSVKHIKATRKLATTKRAAKNSLVKKRVVVLSDLGSLPAH